MNIAWERVASEATQKPVMSPVPLTFACGRMMVNLWISLSALEIVDLQILSQGKHHCICNVHLWYLKIAGNAFAFQYGLNSVSYSNGWNVERSVKRDQIWDQVVKSVSEAIDFPLGTEAWYWEQTQTAWRNARAASELQFSSHIHQHVISIIATHRQTQMCLHGSSSQHTRYKAKQSGLKSIDFYTACRSVILFSTFTALLVLFVCCLCVYVHLWVSLSLRSVDSVNRTQVLRLGGKLYLFVLTHSTLGDLLSNTSKGHCCMRNHLSLY